MNDSRDAREPIFDGNVEPIFDELDEYTPTGPHNAAHMRAVFEPDEFGGRTLPRVTNDPLDRRNRTIMYVVGSLSVIGIFLLARQLIQRDWNSLLAFLTSTAIVIAVAFAGFILLTFLLMIRRDGWRTFRDRLRRRNLEYDLETVRQIAGSPGRQFEICNMIFWTDLPGDAEAQFRSVVDKTLHEFSRATGFAATEGPPVRIFCFAREAEFLSYLRSEFPQLAQGDHFRSFHFHHRKTSGSKIVICGDAKVIFPWTLGGAMAYEITGLLIRTHLNGQQPPWFERGMATMISKHVDPLQSAPGTTQRDIRAEANRRKLLSGCRIVTTNWMHILRRWQTMKGVERMSWFGRFDGQSALFCRYLSEHYPQAFHAFLRTRLTQADVQKLAAVFQKHFQAGPNELMWDCMARELDRAVSPYDSPPEPIKQRIESEFVGQIVNVQASAEDRKFAISKMSGAGYPWRADVLIRILDGPDQELRDDALYALESLSGEVRGPRARDWTEWLNSLPDRVARKL